MHDSHTDHPKGAQGAGLRGFIGSRTGLVCLAFLGIAGFYLLTEHTAHVFGVVSFLLLLACPLLHLFLHGGHGHDGQAGHEEHERHRRGL